MAVSLVSPVLVGRQGEVQTLRDALDRVLAGEQATIAVAAKPESASRGSCMS